MLGKLRKYVNRIYRPRGNSVSLCSNGQMNAA